LWVAQTVEFVSFDLADKGVNGFRNVQKQHAVFVAKRADKFVRLVVAVQVERSAERRIIFVCYPQGADCSFDLEHVHSAENVNRKKVIGVSDKMRVENG